MAEHGAHECNRRQRFRTASRAAEDEGRRQYGSLARRGLEAPRQGTAGNTGGATPLPVAAADQLVKSVSRLSLLTVAHSVDEFCPRLAHYTLQPPTMPNFVETPVESKSEMDALTLSSSDSDELSYPDGGSRAWLIVLGASASTFSTFGYVNSWGASRSSCKRSCPPTHVDQVFQTFYQLHLLQDNSASEISWIGSVQIALTFGLAIFVGRLFDNGWFALPAFCASVALVTLTIITGECTKFWQFLFCQGFAIGVASGIIFGPTLAIVSHWFKRRRSTALGIVAAGSSVGGLIIPILVQQLIPQIGFNWTMRVLALLLLFTTGIMNLCLKRRLPPVKTSGGVFNWRAFKFPPFLLYNLSVLVCFFGLYTLLTYIDVSATKAGIAPSFDVYLVSVANASSGVGRIFTGVLADRIGCMTVMIPGTLMVAVVTIAWPFARSLPSLMVVAVLYGFASGVFVGIQAVPLMHMGEMSDVGRRTGTLFSVLAIGALAGPPVSGAIASTMGSYKPVGYFAGSTMLVALGILWYVRYLMTGKIFGGKF
uniref:MFS general substrate transporter n=1 Tax=Mycena chlorophos TaxID=658473 RepID=A0ABQ0L618_MYCCL|nr:MFS general substrate transporter [Mycena chlorophos]